MITLPQLRPVPVLGTLGLHAVRAGRRLPDSRLFDRLLRGRAWVALLGILLIGLVALNVSLLKLNAEAGRNAETAKSLRIHNTELRAKVSRLASGERLQSVGRQMGLSMSSAGRVRYLSVGRGDAKRAARSLRSLAWTVGFTFPPLPSAAPPPAPAQAAPTAPAQPAGTPAQGTGTQTQTASGQPPAAAPPATTPAQPATGAPAQAQTQPPAAGGAQAVAGATPSIGN